MTIFLKLTCWLIMVACNSSSTLLPSDTIESTFFKDVSGTHLDSNALEQNSMAGNAIDIDQDGDMDMIVACEFCPNILLINDGNGGLTDVSDERFPQTNHDSEDMAISDFDDDGDLDIFFVSEDDQINEYFENKGNAYFQVKPEVIPRHGISNAIKHADLNNDGLSDLVVGNAGQNFIFINHAGTFKDESENRLPENAYTTQDLELVDLDQDGDLDLIEANETYNRILINDGKGSFVYDQNRLPAVNDQTRDVEVGDVDGDGDEDIFFSNVDFGGVGNPQNRLLLNDGNGFFSEVTDQIPLSDFRTVDSNLYDLDNDGDLDLLVGNRFNGLSMMVLINDGQANFKDQTGFWLPEMNVYPFDFQIADFNGDGKKDLYFCNFRGADKLLLRE